MDTFKITRFMPPCYSVTVKEFSTAAEAVAYLEEIGGIFIEEDEKNPGCYDAIDKRGDVYSIEKNSKKVA